MAVPRPQPRLTVDNRFFWTDGEDGRLRFLRCRECETFVHPPFPICHHCKSERLEPTVVAGTGRIDMMTVNHQAWRPGLDTPYIIARIAIDGAPGVYLTSNVIGSPVGDVAIDDAVRVVFEHQDGIWFPLFEKAG